MLCRQSKHCKMWRELKDMRVLDCPDQQRLRAGTVEVMVAPRRTLSTTVNMYYTLCTRDLNRNCHTAQTASATHTP